MTVETFLTCGELDALDDVMPDPRALSPADRSRIAAVIAAWDDEQAVANLLMHPALIADADRVEALLRGLATVGYLQLAAAVGAGNVAEELADADRARMIAALLDVIASNAEALAVRASATLLPLMRRDDAAELVVLLRHPDPAVRSNLRAALLEAIGKAGLRRLLADRSIVAEADAQAARQSLLDDGLDPDDLSSWPVHLPVLPYLPNLSDWHA